MVRVLADYGYKVHPGGQYQEQQFPCDLHGDGRDNKPSARVYPVTNQWFCFACNRSRDVVETVRVKEGLDFLDALNFIETKYELPLVPWEEGDHPTPKEAPDLGSGEYEQVVKAYVAALTAVTEDRLLPMDTVTSHWEAFDKLQYTVGQGQMAYPTAKGVLSKLYERLIAALHDLT